MFTTSAKKSRAHNAANSAVHRSVPIANSLNRATKASSSAAAAAAAAAAEDEEEEGGSWILPLLLPLLRSAPAPTAAGVFKSSSTFFGMPVSTVRTFSWSFSSCCAADPPPLLLLLLLLLLRGEAIGGGKVDVQQVLLVLGVGGGRRRRNKAPSVIL